MSKGKIVSSVVKYSKRMKEAKSLIDKEKTYSVEDAVNLLKQIPKAKFDETLELSLQLGVDPKHADQMVRGVVVMPHGTGKNIRVAVITKGEKQEEAVKAGADLVGAEDLIAKIKEGKIEFDSCIATPDMMGLIGSVAKILGPKGLMPNPKLGSVTMNISSAVKAAKSGQIEFRVEKAGIVHAGFSKLSFTTDHIKENLQTLVSSIVKSKPSGAKGTYLKHAYLSSTMGPSISIDISSINQ